MKKDPFPTRTKPSSQGYFTLSEIGGESTAFYQKNGFLVLANGCADEEIEGLNKECVLICRGERGNLKTKKGFAEPDSAVAAHSSEEALLKQFLCIHFPHKCSPLILRFLSHPAIVEVLTRIIGPNVKCMQSMLFVKSAGKPGQAWHQDEDFIPTRDRSLCGAWIAMDDATVENGCLWVLPGSHLPGVLWPQYPHQDKRFDCTYESFDFPYPESEAVPVEVPKGSIVFFNGYLLHRSLPNTARSGFRRALVNHYMSAESLLPWQYQEGMPMAKTDYRDIVLVAGKDPYPWKNLEERANPHIRPDGEGGCHDGRYNLKAFKKKGLPVKSYL